MKVSTSVICIFLQLVICGNTNGEEMSREQKQTAGFFPEVGTNLTKITWAHAVNSKNLLEKALQSDVMMLEADISIGKLTEDPDAGDIPIMCHPPCTNGSDLSLVSFLQQVGEHNLNNNSKKGVKLDFKTMDAFNNSLQIVKDSQVDYPLWINADIIKGPINATDPQFDAEIFLNQTKQFDNAVFSLGWTTKYGLKENITSGSYTAEQIDQMIDVVKNAKVESRNVTFAIRAGIAAQSKTVLEKLKELFGCTLTVWSSDGDEVDVKKLEEVILSFGVNRVYIDVPDDLMEKIDLTSGSFAQRASALIVSILAAIAVLLY